MAEEHTPGPWHWRETRSPGSGSENGYLRYCRLGNYRGVRVGMMDVIKERDASLIAAAPDLLAACLEFREAMVDMNPEDLQCALGMADVAILKSQDRAPIARLQPLSAKEGGA